MQHPTEDGSPNRHTKAAVDMSQDLVKLPQKRLYRQRAHCNPWSDHSLDYPVRPELFDWSSLYEGTLGPPVTVLDVGCGYGGLLFQLATEFPKARSLGLEIRLKVVDYVQVSADNPVAITFYWWCWR